MIKKTIDLLPIGTIILIYLGYVNIDSFYEEFHLKIYNYITTSEIILSFIPTMINTSLRIYYMFGVAGAVLITIDKISATDNLSWDSYFKRNEKTHRNIRGILVLTLITVIIIILSYKFQNMYAEAYLNLIGYVLTLLTILMNVLTDLSAFMIKKYFFLIVIVTIISIKAPVDIFNALHAKELKLYGSKRNVCFVAKGIQYKSTNTIMFIGETHDYIFMYNRKDSTASVFKKNEVDSLVFK